MSALDKIVILVSNMSCASCVGRVERALLQVPGVTRADVNLASDTATVTFVEGAVSAHDILAASTQAGYAAKLNSQEASSEAQQRKELAAKAYVQRTGLAGILAAPVILLGMGGHVVPGFDSLIMTTIGHQSSWIIQFVFTSLVLFGPGLSFYRLGFPALVRGVPDMNSLVAMGTSAAYLYSVVATFLPHLMPEGVVAVYYEPAALIVVLILFGRFLENRAKGRTGQAIQSLLGLRAKTARVLRGDDYVEVAIDDLAIGDMLSLRPGERVAVDGSVLEGSSHIDESMITGEPEPVQKTAGDMVTGGTVNGLGQLAYQATRVGADTTLSQIIKLVEQAQGAKLPIQGLVDRVTLWFVPAVILLALTTVAVWLAFGPAPSVPYALVAGVSVLIIACPCAMGLATPTSIMVGTGRAAELGVLFRKGDALQRLADVDFVAFDKTGTLTQGRPTLTDFEVTKGFERAHVLATLAAAEQGSEHPLALAIINAAGAETLTLPAAQDFEAIPGLGIRALVAGQEVLIGSQRLLQAREIVTDALHSKAHDLALKGKSAIFAAIDGQLAGIIAVSDALKPTSKAAIARLRACGVQVAMITGDRQETAEAIAKDLGIEHIYAEVLPAEKVAALGALKLKARGLAFVGDGINDAPALAYADVGIAVGTGTDVAIESADVVLMSGDLLGVVNAIEMSRRTLRNIRQNLFWAFGYNVALIPVAAGILYPSFGIVMSPILAAGAMALSSVFVLGNALRLRFVAAVGGAGA